ncbi:MAG: AI-2E family transporter [Methanobrevibacter sp.]|uniref:AI-2E family transporter n=1 Tax=Methanobrevibacter sp. TaxID=66852 RepID=UPI0026DF54CF|nr:AI-2E family transporter [Methanobrevibacter sp.]MDO5848103.1 AI-2E family transporter [Methanobrevibacter sp.]
MEKDIKEYITAPILLIAVLLGLSLCVMVPVLDMVILGAILAFLIRPISLKIQSSLKYSSVSIIVAIILVIIPLILLLAYMLSVIVGVTSDFIAANQISSLNLNQSIATFTNYLPIDYSASSLIDYVDNSINQGGSIVLNYIMGLAKKLPDISIKLFVLICSLFYFARDGNKAYDFVEELVPDKHKNFFKETCSEVKNVLNSIFYGHFLTALILGIIAAVGYSLLGYPYGIFLGILTGIFQLIPVIGPWPIYWVLAIWDFFNGNYVRMIIVLLFGFGLSLSDMYIRPALSSHYAEVPPLILLIGFLAGPLVYGIVGFIMGPLILGITYAVLVSYKNEQKREVE